MITIEKGVPIPPVDRSGSGRKPTYPWNDMEVGDSFTTLTKASSMLGQCQKTGLKLGKKFTVRTENGVTRVWRTE